MKKNILIVALILSILLLVGVILKVNDLNNQLKNKNLEITKLKGEQKDFNEVKQTLIDRINALEEKKDNNVENKKCTFTKTFNVIDTFYYNDGVKNYKYAIVDRFQSNELNVIKITINDSIVEKGKNYEITFESTTDDISSAEVKEIKLTNKEGLDQIQESCN